MSCECPRPIDWDDDVPFMCEDCYEEAVAGHAAFEPADDPQLTNLLPEANTQTIDSERIDMVNVRRLVASYHTVIGHVQTMSRVTDADILGSIVFLASGFARQTVVERKEANPTAAVLNRAAIVQSIEHLLTGIRELDLPQPKVQ